jgi:hypothetical protein
MVVRKAIRNKSKILSPDVETVWLTCAACSCEYEVTKTAADLADWHKKSPNLCFDCFMQSGEDDGNPD